MTVIRPDRWGCYASSSTPFISVLMCLKERPLDNALLLQWCSAYYLLQSPSSICVLHLNQKMQGALPHMASWVTCPRTVIKTIEPQSDWRCFLLSELKTQAHADPTRGCVWAESEQQSWSVLNDMKHELSKHQTTGRIHFSTTQGTVLLSAKSHITQITRLLLVWKKKKQQHRDGKRLHDTQMHQFLVCSCWLLKCKLIVRLCWICRSSIHNSQRETDEGAKTRLHYQLQY